MVLIIHKNTPEQMIKRLKIMGHTVIPSMTYPGLSAAVAEHPDMQIHPLRKDLAMVPPMCYAYYREKLPLSIELISGEKNLGGTYPMDCAYNVAKVKDLLFCNTRCIDPKLLAFYQGERYQIIHTNQGYTKCNMIIYGKNCIITEDVGIHNIIIANKLPIQSILVPVGEISLSGFPHGFIGGAGGGMEDVLFWYGNPQNCSYFETLKNQAERGGIYNIALSQEKLCDLGGIICFSS
ncbi:MAG: hypothetical protein U0L92_08560 [Clostridia bacterium]|nr:hypothetical protein [Clostridia bacterium]